MQVVPFAAGRTNHKYNNKIDFSFSRRINRNPMQTEPVRWYNDRYFIMQETRPRSELAWVYSLLYSLKTGMLFLPFITHGINYINRRLLIDDNGIT